MKILVVEDEHKIAQSIRKGLEQERYIVDVSYTGDEGYDLAATGGYDLIILDRMLPGIDGMKICTDLRRDGIHTPVLMLTAKGQVRDRVEGLDAGADDYLTKPFAFEELLARVRALVRRPREAVDAQRLQVDDLTLNTGTYEVKRGDSPIRLSNREFSLLEYLMRHPNHILTKDQIIDHVWTYDADVLLNTVEVYIGYLRGKIDKPFPRSPLIHTVRGFGYKIAVKP